MSYLFDPAEPIAVRENEQGEPQSFVWRRRTHAVVSIVNHWRVDAGWYQRQERDLYIVMTDTHLRVLIYRDTITGTWHIQRKYD